MNNERDFLKVSYPSKLHLMGKTFESALDAFVFYHLEYKEEADMWDSILFTVTIAKFSQSDSLKIALINMRKEELKEALDESFIYELPMIDLNHYCNILKQVRDLMVEEVLGDEEIQDELVTTLSISNDEIIVHELDGDTSFSRGLSRLACAYLNMSIEDMPCEVDDNIRLKYKRCLLNETDFVLLVNQITDEFDEDSDDYENLISFKVKEAIRYYLTDMGKSNAVEALLYAGY